MWGLALLYRHGVRHGCSIPTSALLSAVATTPAGGHTITPQYYNAFTKRSMATKAKTATHYYDVLELTPKATQKQIKSAYYRLSKLYHPDVNPSVTAHKKFAEISEAYENLGNLARKRAYDRGLYQPYDYGPGEDMTEEYFRNQQFRGRKAPPTGRTPEFDFDEFYRQHYAEQIYQQQVMKERERRHREYVEAVRRQRAFVRSALWTIVIVAIVMTTLDAALQESVRRRR